MVKSFIECKKIKLVWLRDFQRNKKEKILIKFREGYSIELLAKEFNCTKLTISRNLKKYISEHEFKSLNTQNIEKKKIFIKNKINCIYPQKKIILIKSYMGRRQWDKVRFNFKFKLDLMKKDYDFSPFTEIIPLNEEIENLPRKDFSSVPISEIRFPKVVYMVVDKKIELEIKTLKDYPEWHFLSENELE